MSTSATKKLINHMEKCAEMSSSDEDDSDGDKDDKTKTQKLMQPTSFFRFVTQLNNRHSLSKMSTDEEIRAKVLNVCSSDEDIHDIVKMVNDSNDDIHDDHGGDDDKDVVSPNVTIQHEKKQGNDADINDIRQKMVEYERQQLKGVQFINAGDGNPKVVNNYAVTSTTCTLI